VDLLLLKHAETNENVLGIHQGQGLGGVLSPSGIQQARAVAQRLAAHVIDLVLVSPMQRCLDTAALVLEHRSDVRVRRELALSAKNSGYLAGRPRNSVFEEAAREGIPVQAFKPPGGESSLEVQSRIVNLVENLRNDMEGNVLLITHGGVIACLLLHLSKCDFDDYLKFVPAPSALTKLVLSHDHKLIRIDSINSTSHLDLRG
jgi:broad specificity phosphatase PhoE